MGKTHRNKDGRERAGQDGQRRIGRPDARAERPEVEWKTVFTATEPAPAPATAAINGTLIVEVSRLDLGRPLYSLSIGSIGQRGFRKFIPFKYEGSGVIRAADSSHEIAMRLSRLVDEAVGHILGELQVAENARVERASRPRRDFADPGRP